MGGAVSQGINNDDIINKLKVASYIKSAQIEKVFRLVDRGLYILQEDRRCFAYKDTAWRKGNLHLSAPCIYAQVLEGLQLKRGMSFLNLGSGTGYLSTMAGLILGPYGTNHGVELQSDVIAYARERLTNFIAKSDGALDVMDFCRPQFFQGNAYLLDESVQKYDRVYCGAALLASNQKMMLNYLKVGGILVVPIGDQLLHIEKKSDGRSKVKALLPVSFSILVPPPLDYASKNVFLPGPESLSLREMCRLVIRQRLRDNVESANPELDTGLIYNVPLSAMRSGFETDTDDGNDMSDSEEAEAEASREARLSNVLLDLAADYSPPSPPGGQRRRRRGERQPQPQRRLPRGLTGDASDTSDEVSSNRDDAAAEEAVAGDEDDGDSNPEDSRMMSDTSTREIISDEPVQMTSTWVPSAALVNQVEQDSNMLMDAFNACMRAAESPPAAGGGKRGRSESSASAGEEAPGGQAMAAAWPYSGCSSSQHGDHKALKREKFDSGIGDEEDAGTTPNPESSSSDSDLERVSADSSSSSDDDSSIEFESGELYDFVRRQHHPMLHSIREHSRTMSDSDRRKFGTKVNCGLLAPPVKEKYNRLMTAGIKSLPLPGPLKIYVNYDRSL